MDAVAMSLFQRAREALGDQRRRARIMQNDVFDGDLPEDISAVTAHFERLLHSHNLQRGDIVRWKDGLKNRQIPYGKPLIVTGFNPRGVHPSDDPHAMYYQEPLTVSVGFMDHDGEFIEMWLDQRRLEPHPGTLSAAESERLQALKAELAAENPNKGLVEELLGRAGDVAEGVILDENDDILA